MSKLLLPKIVAASDETTPEIYVEAIHRIISQLLPPDFFERENALERFRKALPMISWTSLNEPPFNLSFFLCCNLRPSAYRFFYDMISRWLLPGKRLNVLLQFALDFVILDLSNDIYTGAEVRIRVESQNDLELISKNLPVTESEIRLGIDSYYHANRILEIKGLTTDEKTALIQENITSLIKHRPQDFDYDIFSEMQHFLLVCRQDFKEGRNYKHMSRIITIHYLFRKALKHAFEAFPERRYISVKLIRTYIEIENKKKQVLGIAIALSYLSENESLEQSHIIKAVNSLIPDAHFMADSFIHNSTRNDPIHTFYLEIAKAKSFSSDEINKLKNGLADAVKSRIEKKVNPIFMPENEEEIMRHILTLSSQLKYVHDLPQTVINFSKQGDESLEFLVIFVRVVGKNTRPISDYFKGNIEEGDFFLNRTRNIGALRNKYKKEASVFYFKIGKTPFLRPDLSVDLYKARGEVVRKLTSILGEFRDYNGGTISKERELFSNLKKLLGKTAEEHPFLLEDFFYSLTPSVMRSVLPAEPVKKLFTMHLEERKEDYKFYEDRKYCYALIITKDPDLREKINLLKAQYGDLATTLTVMDDKVMIGLLTKRLNKDTLLNLRLSIEQQIKKLILV